MNDRTSDVLAGPHVADVISMSCGRCDARTTVAVTDPMKVEIVRLFRAAHAGHRPTMTFGRQLHV